MTRQDQPLGHKIGVIAAAFLLLTTTALFIGSAPASGEGTDAPGDTAQITGATKVVKPGTANHIALLTVYSSTGPIAECQGVLVSPTWVLSSSNCADVPTGGRILITLGATNVAKPIKHDFENRSAILSQTVTHPNADNAAWGSYAYEMALFKLNKASTRRPALLGGTNLTASDDTGTLQAYGPTVIRGDDGGTLRQGKVSFSTRARTLEIFSAVSLNPTGAPFADFILSEGAEASHVKACGDPGAPVITNVNGRPTVLALASNQYVFSGIGSPVCNDAAGEFVHFYFNVTSPTNSKWITSVVGKTGPANDVKCAGKPATIFGTKGVDKMVGTSGNDVMVGLNGNDILNGARGKDRLCGGSGIDALIGGAGKDICDGGKQTDRTPQQCETKKKI